MASAQIHSDDSARPLIAFPPKAGIYFRHDRGRENRLGSIPPPSEPDVRISRIRLSGRWFYLQEDWRAWT